MSSDPNVVVRYAFLAGNLVVKAVSPAYKATLAKLGRKDGRSFFDPVEQDMVLQDANITREMLTVEFRAIEKTLPQSRVNPLFGLPPR